MANYLLLAIFHPQKTAFAMAPTVIATVIPRNIMRFLSNNNSMVNQWRQQWLITFFWQYFTLKNSFRNGTIGSHCNGDSH